MKGRAGPIGSAMVSDQKGQRGGRPGAHKGERARAERLRTALRENLKRRKSQARGRAQPDRSGTDAATHESAGFVPDKAPDKSGE